MAGSYLFNQLLQANATGLVTATGKSIATITLTVGDWDVWGGAGFSNGAVNTNFTVIGGVTSTLNGTVSSDAPWFFGPGINTATSLTGSGVVPNRFQVATGTLQLWLTVAAFFNAGPVTAWGFIAARNWTG